MTTPTVKELPLRLQPTHHDPFIDRLAVVPGNAPKFPQVAAGARR